MLCFLLRSFHVFKGINLFFVFLLLLLLFECECNEISSVLLSSINRPFHRYGGHIELIRFKEYYRMPRGHGHILFVCTSAFRDIFFLKFSENKILMGKKDSCAVFVPFSSLVLEIWSFTFTFQKRHNDLFPITILF